MRTLLISTLILLLIGSLAAEPVTAGIYKGKYEGSAGASGDFQVTLTRDGGAWTGAVEFSLNGEQVKCKVTSVQVTGDKLKIVYGFDLGGTALESSIEGELSGSTLAGKYHTQVAGDGSTVDDGKWSASSSR